MPRSLSDLAHSLKILPRELQDAQAAGVRKAALHVTTEIRNNIRGITGDMKLSGVGKSGARVGARYDIKGAVNPSALVKAIGPIQLIENNTAPHEITPRGKSARARNSGSYARGKRALKLPGGQYYARVEHPGTKGQKPFERGVNSTAPDTVRIFDLEVGKAITRSF